MNERLTVQERKWNIIIKGPGKDNAFGEAGMWGSTFIIYIPYTIMTLEQDVSNQGNDTSLG